MTRQAPFAAYDRKALQPTVVHIGPGVFHRAHQAVYGDAVLRTGSQTGAVYGISLRSAAVRDSLAPQGFVYHVVERASDGRDVREVVRPVGALLGVDVAAQSTQTALDTTGRRGRHGRDDHGHGARLLQRRPGRRTRPRPPGDRARPARASLPPFASWAPRRGARSSTRQRHRPVHGRVLRQPAVERSRHRPRGARARRVSRPLARRMGRRQRRLPIVDGRPDGSGDNSG